MKAFTIVCLMASCISAWCQNFAEKTNAIKLDLTKPMPATPLPSITWISPRIERSNSVEQSVTFEATVHSDVPLKSVHFELINGDETRIKTLPIAGNEVHKKIRQQITLLAGESIVKLTAVNVRGGQVSSARSVLVGMEAIEYAVDINRKDYALIIATDSYDHWGDLVNPINDGQTIAALLRDKYGFETDILTNPTLEEINDKLYDYNTKRFNPQDQLFVFVAGHGFFDETLGEGYLVASNSLKNDKGKSSYLPHLLLRERLDNIKCEHVFLAMDVCFGGTFDPILAKARAEDAADETADTQYLVKKLTKRTRKYITSGSKEYVSDGIPGKHSPFAEKFILALKEIGGGTGRILSLFELNTYFLKLTSEPRFGGFGTDDPASDFVFVAEQ